jgi:hypothetical protein
MLPTETSYDVVEDVTGIALRSNGRLRIFYPNMGTDATAFTNVVTGQKLVYELAAKTTYSLTVPQVRSLLGLNNVFADTGLILSVEYSADAKEYIDDHATELYETKASVVNVTSDEQEAVKTIPDGMNDMPMAVKVGIAPVQDLHGYANPWPGGGGKNLIPMSLSEFKELNTSGTWDGNAYTRNGVTFTDNGDGSVTINGTSSAIANFQIWKATNIGSGQTLSVTSFRSGTSNGTIGIYDTVGGIQEQGSGSTATYESGYDGNYRIQVPANVTCTNYIIRPMFVSGSTLPTVYEPYSNICPISGWTGCNVTRTGKNLVSGVDASGGTLGKIEGYKTSGSYKMNYIYTHLKAGKTYTISFDAMEGNETATGFIALYPLINGVVGNRIVSPYISAFVDDNGSDALGASYKRIKAVLNPIMDINQILIGYYRSGKYCLYDPNTLMIEEGSVATEYESYLGTTYSITFPSSAGTVYGGELTVNKDGTGMLIVDKADYTFSTGRTWTYQSNNKRFYSTALSNMKLVSSFSSKANALSDQYKIVSVDDLSGSTDYALAIGVNASSSSSRYIWARNLSCTTSQEMNNALNGVHLVYELSEPVIYQLAVPQVHSLLGINNIFADTGDVLSIDYSADTKLYANKTASGQVIAFQNALIAPVLSRMVADTALSVNDFRIVNGTLYKVTTSIASGGTLTVGTNVVATNLGELITAILNAN